MTDTKLTILIVDDEINMRRILEMTLKREGYDTVTAENGVAALKILDERVIHIVLTDLKMPDVDGMTLLRECNTHHPDIPLIMLTAHGTVETAVEAMKIGAFDFISKPFDIIEVRHSLKKAAGQYLRNRSSLGQQSEIKLQEGNKPATRTVISNGIIASSPRMHSVLELVQRVADSPSTILLTGESGTGKELIASMIHSLSSRRDKPLIKVNCAAIPETLLESEFFGHERGAFTGAVTSKPGRFELAHGGTLFLDEISEISPEIQVKLLRAIQEREFERVGGIRTVQVDVRLVAATNLNLEREVDEGRFRQDLFYRLNVVPIQLPPLRSRVDDIPHLVKFFIKRMNTRLKRSVHGVSDNALAALENYSWPGNIRELENVIERAVLLCSGDIIEPDILNIRRENERTERSTSNSANQLLTDGRNIKEIIQEETDRVEYSLLLNALQRTGGNVTRASKLLGLSRKGLQLKLRRHNLDPRNLPETPDFLLT